jgi:hypothetical protein
MGLHSLLKIIIIDSVIGAEAREGSPRSHSTYEWVVCLVPQWEVLLCSFLDRSRPSNRLSSNIQLAFIKPFKAIGQFVLNFQFLRKLNGSSRGKISTPILNWWDRRSEEARKGK